MSVTVTHPSCIISGGQTGADQGGLIAAQALGLETGGWAPLGWRTEAGPNQDLGLKYGLIQWDTDNYRDRTIKNVMFSDATVIFGRRSPGSNMTEEACRRNNKPCLWVWWPEQFGTLQKVVSKLEFRTFIRQNRVDILNVAGNRESKNPGIQSFTDLYLMEALKR